MGTLRSARPRLLTLTRLLNIALTVCLRYGHGGKVKIDRDEIIDPLVQVIGDAAILSFRFVSHGSEGSMRWNCTEVYKRLDGGWKIVHTHWSFTKAGA